MKISRLEDVPQSERKDHIRQGKFRYWQLLEGEDGPGNFSLQLVRLADDFYSPRHRHNFEQIRIQVEGTFDFGQSGVMHSGTVGYFPEGVPYGPQKVAAPGGAVLVLQFGGISGNGYLSEAMQQKGSAELHAKGAFRNGAFMQVDSEGRKRNQDGFEAVWEHLMGRPISYPASNYEKPVLVDSAQGDWRALGKGLGERVLGRFEDSDLEIRALKLDTGAGAAISGPAVMVALRGEGQVAGRPWSRLSAISAEDGEEIVIEATAESEILVMRLPRLAAVQPLRAAG